MNDAFRTDALPFDLHALASAAGLPLAAEDVPSVAEAMREYQEHVRILVSVELPLDATPALALDPTRWTAPNVPEARGRGAAR